jgi:hypothetical protein
MHKKVYELSSVLATTEVEGFIVKRRMKRDDKLVLLLQAYIQRQANPERVGCPPAPRLASFARGQFKPTMAGELYEHLSHCRECLWDLKALRDGAGLENQTERVYHLTDFEKWFSVASLIISSVVITICLLGVILRD